MAVNMYDPGDKNDIVKWDFKEDMKNYRIGKYIYKARNKKNAEILDNIRINIDRLCNRLKNNWYTDDSYINNINLFLSIHDEYYYNPYELPHPFFEIADQGHKISRYMLSEMPNDTGFSGLNKPKQRYFGNDNVSIGKDNYKRALYRDIFLDLNSNDLDALIIHELAHTMCNHIYFRTNDHGNDFKKAEKIITNYYY